MTTNELNRLLELRTLRKLSVGNLYQHKKRDNIERQNELAKIILECDKQITKINMGNCIWKEVSGYNGVYLVSKCGKIYSKIWNRLISGSPNNEGYVQISLQRNDKKMKVKLHRIVALAFIPNPENKPQVNHNDFNKENNSVNNLTWATPQEDADHKVANNRQAKGISFPPRKGVKQPKRNLYILS